MSEFQTMRVPPQPIATALDGSDVRGLLAVAGGSSAHLELAPGKTSRAVAHRTIDEVYFFVGGRGELWRRQGSREEIVPVGEGVCLTVPAGVHFQFRSFGYAPLAFYVVAMPPYPGGDEAYEVSGPWTANVSD